LAFKIHRRGTRRHGCSNIDRARLTAVRALRRRGHIVSWRPQAAATRYLVELVGARTLRTVITTRPRYRIPTGTVRVEVVAVGADGQAIKAAVITLTHPA
jgi:hypothetical protein